MDLDSDSNHTSFASEDLVLAVEVCSPGDTHEERDTKIAGYAAARVPYPLIVELPEDKPACFWGYRLGESGYRWEVYVAAGETVVAPGPLPITANTSELLRRRLHRDFRSGGPVWQNGPSSFLDKCQPVSGYVPRGGHTLQAQNRARRPCGSLNCAVTNH
ncbi:Uma2 family endonuclease [Nocardia nepalensis]|uniref:Uma2 family endonuclease n=1 Tax=Nocardia nepalensis TaxID=3375448 RepID=UPI003B673186